MRTDREGLHFVSRMTLASILGLALVFGGGSVYAQQPGTAAPAQTPQGAQTAQPDQAGQQAQSGQQPANTRVFASDAGLVLNFIKPDKAADFEQIVTMLRDALNKSDKPERKQQAASWKVFRALEPGANGSVLYVFQIDPAVKGADYTVSTILAEGFPDQVQDLFKRYADAYVAGQNVVNLKLVASLAQ